MFATWRSLLGKVMPDPLVRNAEWPGVELDQVVTLSPPILVASCGADDGPNRVIVSQRVFHFFQNDDAYTLASSVTVGPLIEAKASTVGT